MEHQYYASIMIIIFLRFFSTTFQLYRPVTHLPLGIGNCIQSHEKNMQLKRTLFVFMVPDATTFPLQMYCVQLAIVCLQFFFLILNNKPQLQAFISQSEKDGRSGSYSVIHCKIQQKSQPVLFICHKSCFSSFSLRVNRRYDFLQ